MYEHVERYLVGACNEDALESWRLAVGAGLKQGLTLDVILGLMAELYTAHSR